LPTVGPSIFYLVLASTVGNGLLAGAGLDYMIKQLPARHRIGIVAYAQYFRASDLANGRFWYIPLGVGMYVLNIGSGIAALVMGVAYEFSIPIYAASGFTLVHLIGTSRAAPAGLSVRKIQPDNKAELARALETFVKWSYQRAAREFSCTSP
jgi:hypothetical protein